MRVAFNFELARSSTEESVALRGAFNLHIAVVTVESIALNIMRTVEPLGDMSENRSMTTLAYALDLAPIAPPTIREEEEEEEEEEEKEKEAAVPLSDSRISSLVIAPRNRRASLDNV